MKKDALCYLRAAFFPVRPFDGMPLLGEPIANVADSALESVSVLAEEAGGMGCRCRRACEGPSSNISISDFHSSEIRRKY